MDHEDQYPEWWDDGPAPPLHPLGFALAALADVAAVYARFFKACCWWCRD